MNALPGSFAIKLFLVVIYISMSRHKEVLITPQDTYSLACAVKARSSNETQQ
jgi:hypothetical protein